MNKSIEVIGIGIESNAVEKFYPKFVVLNDVKELPKEALKQLSKLLLENVE